jgi:3-phosphoshikimate 1-carboxyvinyltransferase
MSDGNKTLTVHPGSPLRGEYCLPGDKPLSHRAALFAALAQGKSRIDHFLVAGVTRAMLEALSDLGVVWYQEG